MPLSEQVPVDVWTVALDEPRSAILSPQELERAANFRSDRDRIHWTNARSALRFTLAQYLNAKPLELRFTYGPHGKPALEKTALHFNLSHASEWAMIAVARSAPVGIDIERVRENVDIAKLLHRIGESPQPEATTAGLFRLWARREAKTKALGIPLMEIPSGDLRVVCLIAPDGYAAALAVAGHDPHVIYRKFQGI